MTRRSSIVRPPSMRAVFPHTPDPPRSNPGTTSEQPRNRAPSVDQADPVDLLGPDLALELLEALARRERDRQAFLRRLSVAESALRTAKSGRWRRG